MDSGNNDVKRARHLAGPFAIVKRSTSEGSKKSVTSAAVPHMLSVLARYAAAYRTGSAHTKQGKGINMSGMVVAAL